jgi:hypothetical protein
MGYIETLISLVVLVLLLKGVKALWVAGFTAGSLNEAKYWLQGVDSLMVPNWQSLPIAGDDLTPEQTKFANRIYVSAYALALRTIQTELAEARRAVVEKERAEDERMRKRFGDE